MCLRELQERGWTPEYFVREAMTLDRQTLPRLVRRNEGEFHQWVEVASEIPDTTYILLENDERLVGYWAFVPLFKQEYLALKKGKMSIDQIMADKMPVLHFPGTFYAYFVIITILPKYRYAKAIRMLFESLFDALENLAKSGVFFKEICADAYTVLGKTLCVHLGLKKVKSHPVRGQIYSRTLFPFPTSSLLQQRRKLRRLYATHFAHFRDHKELEQRRVPHGRSS